MVSMKNTLTDLTNYFALLLGQSFVKINNLFMSLVERVFMHTSAQSIDCCLRDFMAIIRNQTRYIVIG